MCWCADRGLPPCEGEVPVLLDLPDIRQTADYDCGAAVVDVVLKFHGVRSCAAVLLLANPVQGCSPDTVEAMLRRAGLPVQSGTMTVEDLRHHTRQGRPVLCPVARYGGHWVVVRGVRGGVYYHDPLVGPTRAPALAWQAEWRDLTRNDHAFDRWGIAAG